MLIRVSSGVYDVSGLDLLSVSSTSADQITIERGELTAHRPVLRHAASSTSVPAPIFANGEGSRLRLRGLQLNGTEAAPSLLVEGGTLVLDDCVLTGSTGDGAMLVNGGVVECVDSELSHNHAVGRGGGAILVRGGNVHVTNSRFSDNSALATPSLGLSPTANPSGRRLQGIPEKVDQQVSGGAVAVEGDANVTIDGSLFTQNAAGDGGAIAVTGAGAVVRIASTELRANRASHRGGALLVVNGSVQLLNRTRFRNNTAAQGASISLLAPQVSTDGTIAAVGQLSYHLPAPLG